VTLAVSRLTLNEGANTGKSENGVVKKVQDGKTYAQPSSVMRVTVTPAMPAM
jgi:hypothetical protein